ncbi:hypothetical protein NIES4071_77270 [Calothrix sp. NIES-4071]|nr:hypothetical protein NIES4071_77270 [Calothrix sp. NIES-4071]BAZ62000.1 hypothetical protein NIES4105_77210 [Calothrix sp. NIES-4105]
MSLEDYLVPKENIEAYNYLFMIETGLRELIIEELQRVEIKWYKTRLPEDIKKKYIDGKKAENNIKWSKLILHHPIYYVDFPDLKKVIESNTNWKGVFDTIFGRKEILSATLSEIEYVRNKVAHNRKVIRADVDIVKGAYTKISNAVGEGRFKSLASKCTLADDITSQLVALKLDANNFFVLINNYKIIDNIKIWACICDSWWFDFEYLNHSIDAIKEFFKLVEQYMELPRVRGSGHKIESWVKSNNVSEKYNHAIDEIMIIISEKGEF